MFDCRNGEMEDDLLLLIAAVRSIIGQRNFCKSYREVITRRMYGGDGHNLSRWRFDKLFNKAQTRHLCTRVPAGRGFYISVRYRTDQLVLAVENRITKRQAELQRISEGERRLKNLKKVVK